MSFARIWLLASILLLFTACSIREDAVEGGEYVPVAFSLALEQGEATAVKSVDAVIQTEGSEFRGVTNIVVFPFDTRGLVGIDDKLLGYMQGLENINSLYATSNSALYQRKAIPRNTASVLFYGIAPVPENADKAIYGSLQSEGLPLALYPNEIQFYPDPIPALENTGTIESRFVSYLNNIARITGFEANYPDLFSRFVNGGQLMSGSGNSIRVLVQDLYNEVNQPGYSASFKQAILNLIKTSPFTVTNNIVTFPDDYLNYPGSGLPEGCVSIQWNGTSFSMNPAGAYLTGRNMYCYPAALWYFVNSQLRTTNSLGYSSLQEYYTNNSSWASILSHYSASPGIIYPETKAAALEKPIQYGVGLFEMNLAKLSSGTLLDRKNNPVPANNNQLPVIGLIVGGQDTLRFDFSPKEKPNGASDEDYRFSYDTHFDDTHKAWISSKSNPGGPLRTMVCASHLNGEIPFALECRNNSGTSFVGATGTVLPGGIFYLVGRLKLSDLSEAERTIDGVLVQRIFEQDRKTSVTVTVQSLKDAYNVVPDLRQPRLQVSLSVTFDWNVTTSYEELK